MKKDKAIGILGGVTKLFGKKNQNDETYEDIYGFEFEDGESQMFWSEHKNYALDQIETFRKQYGSDIFETHPDWVMEECELAAVECKYGEWIEPQPDEDNWDPDFDPDLEAHEDDIRRAKDLFNLAKHVITNKITDTDKFIDDYEEYK